MQALSKAKAGENYTIKWMFGLPDVLEFLRGRHVEEGTTLQVVRNSGEFVIIGVEGHRYVLGNGIADRIQV